MKPNVLEVNSTSLPELEERQEFIRKMTGLADFIEDPVYASECETPELCIYFGVRDSEKLDLVYRTILPDVEQAIIKEPTIASVLTLYRYQAGMDLCRSALVNKSELYKDILGNDRSKISHLEKMVGGYYAPQDQQTSLFWLDKLIEDYKSKEPSRDSEYRIWLRLLATLIEVKSNLRNMTSYPKVEMGLINLADIISKP